MLVRLLSLQAGVVEVVFSKVNTFSREVEVHSIGTLDSLIMSLRLSKG